MDVPVRSSGTVATASLPAHPTASPSGAFVSRQNAPAVMMAESLPADDRTRRATSVLSMDDLEAAQALEGLRSGM